MVACAFLRNFGAAGTPTPRQDVNAHLLAAMLDLSRHFVGLLDREGTLLQANRTALAAVDRQAAEVLGRPFWEGPWWSHSTQQQQRLREAIARGIHGEDSHFETTHAASDGSLIHVDFSLRPMHGGDGQVSHLLVEGQDITRRKQVEEELRRSNAELEQFAYAASHDMRQPLRMIASYQQLLEKALKDALTDETREYLHFATDGARRLDQMLVGLLDYSRVGRKTEPMARIETRAALDEALLFLQAAIADHGAHIQVCGTWPALVGSRDELTRLLQNLIDNAIKYHRPGKAPRVAIESDVVDGQWRVRIVDQGIGITTGQDERLFQVFQRLQPRSRFDGTGIGLALCRKIVEHHGGCIGAHSAGDDQGAEFWFSLPLRHESTT